MKIVLNFETYELLDKSFYAYKPFLGSVSLEPKLQLCKKSLRKIFEIPKRTKSFKLTLKDKPPICWPDGSDGKGCNWVHAELLTNQDKVYMDLIGVISHEELEFNTGEFLKTWNFRS